jgi:hypothetical protein
MPRIRDRLNTKEKLYFYEKYGRWVSPYFHFFYGFLIMLFLMLVGRLAGQPLWVWGAAFLSLIIVAFFNATAIVWVGYLSLYIKRSLLLLIVFWMVSLLLAGLISGVTLDQLGPAVMVYLVMFIYYPIYFAVALFVRFFIHRRKAHAYLQTESKRRKN